MLWLALGLLVLGLVIVYGRGVPQAGPAYIKLARWIAASILGGTGVFLFATGRFVPALVSLSLAALMLRKLMPGLMTKLGLDKTPPPAAEMRMSDAMTRAEALHVLGLSEGASADDVVQAHRRLIVRLHPDQGGSDYLAAKINRAKDLLLKR